MEENRQRIVLSQLQVGIQPEGLNMLLNINYSLFHLGIFFQIESTFIVLQHTCSRCVVQSQCEDWCNFSNRIKMVLLSYHWGENKSCNDCHKAGQNLTVILLHIQVLSINSINIICTNKQITHKRQKTCYSLVYLPYCALI